MLDLIVTVTDRGLVPLGALILALLLLANEIGYRIGRWRAGRGLAKGRTAVGEDTNIGMLTAGMLGLLAFTLGLTLSIAESRFEARRDQVVVEANAIGTAWLRASLLRGEAGPTMRRQIEDYARLRLDFLQAPPDPPRLVAMNAATNAAQTSLWRIAEAAAARDPTPITASVVVALNDMFDAALAARYALESRVPSHIILLLLIGSLLAIGSAGMQLGLGPERHLVMSGLLMLMWTGGMLLIADLSRPRQGAIMLDPAPLVWTLQGFGSGAPPAAK
jgi:hypothetical protein